MNNPSRMIVLFSLLAGFTACGPIESSVVIRDANVQLEAARVSDASRFAQFEYRAAQEYLHKAREEQSYSEYQEAIELAQLAFEYAEKARARALGHSDRGPAKPVIPPQPPRPEGVGPSGS